MKVLFSKKIVCSNCGSNFKGKMERRKRVYVCSKYDNCGGCVRTPIKEDMLIELLIRRYGNQFNVSKENVQSVVESIEVKDKMTFTIKLVDSDPIVFGDNYIQY